jgi:hypothetical protein
LEFFLKHQKIIFRSLGSLMLLVGFVVHFWLTPKEVVSKNSMAAANVARMEASVSGHSSKSNKSKPDTSHFLKAFEETKKKQMEYLTIIAMIFGIGFLAYSFFKKGD